MYHFIQKFHSGWAYIALLLLVFAVINSFIGKSSDREFTGKDRKIALFGLIGVHVQLLVGIILYFVSPLGLASAGNMAESDVRITWLEHPIINILAIALVTVGWIKHKKADTNKGKFNSIAIFYLIGLVLVLSRIPWKLWF